MRVVVSDDVIEGDGIDQLREVDHGHLKPLAEVQSTVSATAPLLLVFVLETIPRAWQKSSW
jgi:hypothetical protein